MSSSTSTADDRGDEARPSLGLTPLQRLAVVVIVVIMAILGVQVIQLTASRSTTLQSIVDSDDATGNAFFTQRETLVLAVDYERWMSGDVTRRDVLIRRALLGQRLSVKSADGLTNAERAHPEYLQALLDIDECLEAAPDGILPESSRDDVRSRCGDPLDVLVFEARQLAIDISNAGDERLRSIVDADRQDRRDQVGWILLTIGVLALTAVYLAVSRTLDLRRSRRLINFDRQDLDEAHVALAKLEAELKARISRDERRRAEDQRLDSAVRMLATDLRRSTSPPAVVETLGIGIEYMLATDLVYVHLFGNGDHSDLGCAVRDGKATSFRLVDVGVDRDLSVEMRRVVEGMWRETENKTLRVSELERYLSPELMENVRRLRIPENAFLTAMGEGQSVIGYVIIGKNSSDKWKGNEIVSAISSVSQAANSVAALRATSLVQKVRESEQIVAELRELDRIKDEFIANVNHELRTPLTSIIGYLEVIGADADDLPSETRSYLATVRRNADRLLQLIEQLLVVSRASSESAAGKHEVVDLADVVVKAVGAARAKDPSSTVVIETSIDSSDFSTIGDRLRLEQVVVNLVGNAVKFSHDYSVVTVELHRVESQPDEIPFAELKVTDHGIGIPADEIPRLFDRFFRASNAETALIPGTGLGLAIVDLFVAEHQGSIAVESEVGVGTTMSVRLPLASDRTR